MSILHSLLILDESPNGFTINANRVSAIPNQQQSSTSVDLPNYAPTPSAQDDEVELSIARIDDLSLREVKMLIEFVESTAFYIERLEEAISEPLEDFWDDRDRVRQMLNSLL